MITRRAVLAGLGMTGMRQQPPSWGRDYQPPAAGIVPGQRANVRARQVIVFGPGDGSVGVFVYSGPPATGNLRDSIAPQGGSDLYGNAYLAGFESQSVTGAYAQLHNAVLFLANGDAPGAQLAEVAAGILAIRSGHGPGDI